MPGIGARTVRALAMVAEVVHRAPCRLPILAVSSRTAGRPAPLSGAVAAV